MVFMRNQTQRGPRARTSDPSVPSSNRLREGVAQPVEQPVAGEKQQHRAGAEREQPLPVAHRTVVEDQDPRLKHPIRSLPVESYVIFFRVIEEHAVVRILRVLHGAQRRPKHF